MIWADGWLLGFSSNAIYTGVTLIERMAGLQADSFSPFSLSRVLQLGLHTLPILRMDF